MTMAHFFNQQKLILLILYGTLINVFPSALCAESMEYTGLEIAKEAEIRDQGFGDYQASLEMILRNKLGQETQRLLRSITREQTNDGDKNLILFDTPRDLKGVAFLSHTHGKGTDDQWLFLPALKRVKRIASNNKSGPFMGSEFAYEDISSQELEKYTYHYVGDEMTGGRGYFKVERIPSDPKSGYSKQMVWYGKSNYLVWKVQYYDKKNKHLKTLIYKDYQQYLGKYWRANQMDMLNVQTGKSTTLKYTNYKFSIGTTDIDFSPSRLKRSR